MDINVISNILIAKSCTRTNGSDTIDGNTVTGVQITAPIEDDLSPAETYYGPGELVIADPSGLVMTNTTITTAGKSLEEINLHQRSFDGLHFYKSQPNIVGKNITGYRLTPYKAPAEQVSIVHTIDNTLFDTTYILKIRRINTDFITDRDNCVKSVSFKTAVTGSTAAQIATALVAEINSNFNKDITIPLIAVVTNTNAIKITAKPLEFIVGAMPYQKLQFVVELVNFTATVVDNVKANLTYNAVTYLQATPGAGTYDQIVEMEWFAKMESGVNKQKINSGYRIPEASLDAQKYQTDGVTLNCYDTIVINWVNTQGDFSQNVRHDGSIIICLPKESNTSRQQTAIVAALNAYINGVYGVPAMCAAPGSGLSGVTAGNIVLA